MGGAFIEEKYLSFSKKSKICGILTYTNLTLSSQFFCSVENQQSCYASGFRHFPVTATASSNFKFSAFIPRSLIHFYLILVQVRDIDLVSIFCLWITNFPGMVCLDGSSFADMWLWPFCRNQMAEGTKGCFCAFYFIPLIYVSIFVPVECHVVFVIIAKHKREHNTRSHITQESLLWFCMNFRTFPSSVKNVVGIVIETALNSQIIFGDIAILTILILPCQK